MIYSPKVLSGYLPNYLDSFPNINKCWIWIIKLYFWEKSISLNDVRTGLPSIFAFHNLERENKDIVKVTGKILNLRYTIEVRFLPPGFDMHIRFTMNSVDINNPNEFDINDETLLDIVNAYHIRMNRLKCVRLDATYAPRRH